jgi:hypothetical protein
LAPLGTSRASLSDKTVSASLIELTKRPEGDEIGDLGRSLVTFKQDALEATRIRCALDTCPTNVNG